MMIEDRKMEPVTRTLVHLSVSTQMTSPEFMHLFGLMCIDPYPKIVLKVLTERDHTFRSLCAMWLQDHDCYRVERYNLNTGGILSATKHLTSRIGKEEVWRRVYNQYKMFDSIVTQAGASEGQTVGYFNLEPRNVTHGS